VRGKEEQLAALRVEMAKVVKVRPLQVCCCVCEQRLSSGCCFVEEASRCCIAICQSSPVWRYPGEQGIIHSVWLAPPPPPPKVVMEEVPRASHGGSELSWSRKTTAAHTGWDVAPLHCFGIGMMPQ
jgi:hypothetical protein